MSLNQSILIDDTAKVTLARLQKSMQVNGDLPGLSSAVQLIQQAHDAQEAMDNQIVQAVLADPALTQKVLRLANSTMYSTFGGQVSTISRAINLLGTDTIAHLACSQKLINDMTTLSGDRTDMQGAMEEAVLAGHIARQLAQSTNIKDTESAAICALLYSMGKLLLAYYLPEEYEQLKKQTLSSGEPEQHNAIKLLGLSLEDLGRETAKEWGLPSAVLDGLRFIPPNDSQGPVSAKDRLATISTFSHECAEAMSGDEVDGGEGKTKVALLASKYAKMLGAAPEQLMSSVQEAQSVADAEKRTVNGGKAGPSLVKGIPVKLAQLVEEGLTDIGQSAKDTSPGKLLAIVGETLYTALGLNRAFIFIKKNSTFTARIGFGPGVPDLLNTLSFEESTRLDAVNFALSRNKLMYVDDVMDSANSAKLPLWWKLHFNHKGSFVVLPIIVKGKPLGFIYGEWLSGYPNTVLQSTDMPHIEKLHQTVSAFLSR